MARRCESSGRWGAGSRYASGQVGRTGQAATNILPLDPIVGVEFVPGACREALVVSALRALLPERGVNALRSDMVPNLSAIDAVHRPRSMDLA